MNRREAVRTLVALSAVAGSLAASAQQPAKVWRVGFLSLTSSSVLAPYTRAFLRAMQELGYVEGTNLVVEWRFAEGRVERLPNLAADLVRSKVDVIVALPSSAIGAAQKATSTIPIVMATSGDPVRGGLVKSLARPGGNITGLSTLGGDTGDKIVDLLRSVVPNLARVAVLDNMGTTFRTTSKSIAAGARKAGLSALMLEASTTQEIENAFSSMARERVDAAIVGTATFSALQQRQIAEAALRHRIPTMFANREYVEAGGLMSYGTKFTELFQRAATYVDRIFKGAKPGDLPVEQPVTIELVVNLNTAKALGLTIPQSILMRADEVIR